MIEVSNDTHRLFAVAALVGHCEALAASGILPEPVEASLRCLIAETLTAHNMPMRDEIKSAHERAIAAIDNCKALGGMWAWELNDNRTESDLDQRPFGGARANQFN